MMINLVPTLMVEEEARLKAFRLIDDKGDEVTYVAVNVAFGTLNVELDECHSHVASKAPSDGPSVVPELLQKANCQLDVVELLDTSMLACIQ